MTEQRMTATQYLASRGFNVEATSVDALKRIGGVAARLGYARKIPAVKVRERGFTVHTWPREVWEAAERTDAAGESGPSRPATHRQIGYLMLLACEEGRGSEFLRELDNEMTEEEAGRRLDRERR